MPQLSFAVTETALVMLNIRPPFPTRTLRRVMVEERQKGGDALGGQHGSDLRRQGHFLALPDRGFRAILIFDSHQMVRIASQPEGVCEVRLPAEVQKSCP